MEAGVREPMIQGDAEQIKQVFFNVIGNAIDAVPEGSEIRVISGLDDEYVFAQVVDQGSGIAKKIFPEFLNRTLAQKKAVTESA